MPFPVMEASKFVAFQTLLLLAPAVRPRIAFACAADDRRDTDADLRDG